MVRIGIHRSRSSPGSLLATKSCRTLSDVSCLPEDRPQSPDLFYELLLHNFERHSSLSIGRRSPFVIELDFSWLEAKKSARLDALLRFISQILNSPQHRHVYFVSIERALEWLKSPCSLDELRNFWAFRCSDVPHQYSVDCSQVDDDDHPRNSRARRRASRIRRMPVMYKRGIDSRRNCFPAASPFTRSGSPFY